MGAGGVEGWWARCGGDGEEWWVVGGDVGSFEKGEEGGWCGGWPGVHDTPNWGLMAVWRRGCKQVAE